MEKNLRLAVGIMGNATSLLLYGSPVLTFVKVIKDKKVGEYSCIPYVIALFNCLTYVWYGFPVVSNGWENFLVVTVNGAGIFPECFSIITYLIFAPPKMKLRVGRMLVGALVLFAVLAVLSAFALHDHEHRKFMIGMVGIASSIGLYSSPLVVMKLVIKTKSVEFMPFYLSFFSFFNSFFWMTYGALGRDIFIAIPNIIGVPLTLAQLILYCCYRKRKTCQQTGTGLDPEVGLKTNGALNGNSEEKSKSPSERKVEMQKTSTPQKGRFDHS
jgi:solute carrier family 50 protein (sugar transporter)